MASRSGARGRAPRRVDPMTEQQGRTPSASGQGSEGAGRGRAARESVAEYDRALLRPARTPDHGHEAWRLARIQGEFVNGVDLLGTLGPAVAVFGSARLGEGHPAYEPTREVGRLLAESGFAVVTGGGPGLMEAANRGAREGDGVSVGLGIALPFEKGFNDYVEVSVPFHYFFARKVNFVRFTDGAVVCPGGLGTLDELFEILTLLQTGKAEDYPVALLGTAFWEPLLAWLRSTLLTEGTISPEDLDRALVTDDPREAVEHATGAALAAARAAVDAGVED